VILLVSFILNDSYGQWFLIFILATVTYALVKIYSLLTATGCFTLVTAYIIILQ